MAATTATMATMAAVRTLARQRELGKLRLRTGTAARAVASAGTSTAAASAAAATARLCLDENGVRAAPCRVCCVSVSVCVVAPHVLDGSRSGPHATRAAHTQTVLEAQGLVAALLIKAQAPAPLAADEVARVAKLASLPVQPTHAADLAAVVAFVAQVQAVPVGDAVPARTPFAPVVQVPLPVDERGAIAPESVTPPGRTTGIAAAESDTEHVPTAALLANAKSRHGPYFAVRSPRASAAS